MFYLELERCVILRLVELKDIKQDMVLAKSIYTTDGKLLLSNGSQLAPKFVKRLQEMGIPAVYIVEPEVGKIEITEVLAEQIRVEAKHLVAKAINDYFDSGMFNGRDIKKVVEKILDDILSNENVLVQLSDIKSLDETEYVFSHSVNVCVLSLVTGISLKYNKAALFDLGSGALLHDVGKSKVPQAILNKPGKLSSEEYAEVKMHCEHGQYILKGQKNIQDIIVTIAYQHHEHFNGNGYPKGIKGDEIHTYSRIVAIADVYDALTSDRVYRKRFLPHEAAEYLQSFAGHQFDEDLVGVFLGNVAVYPPGTKVLLSNDKHAVVVKCHKEYPTRPLIRILNPGMQEHFTELELKNHPSIFIREVLE